MEEKVFDQDAVGEILKQARRRRGMKQWEVGERLGVSHRTVSAYESGTSMLRLDMFFRYGRLFPEIITEMAEMFLAEGSHLMIVSDDEAVLLQALHEKIRLKEPREISRKRVSE
jgi:transcriptional regulator with XRE-family HTH domain